MAENDFDKTVKLPAGTPSADKTGQIPPADKTGQIPAADQTMKLAPDPDKTMKLSSAPPAPAQPEAAAPLPPPPPPPAPARKSRGRLMAWVSVPVLLLLLAGAWAVLPSVLMKKASAQSAAGNHAQAAQILQKILLLRPLKPEVYSLAWGRELNRASDFTQAQKVLEPLVEKDAGNLEAQRELGRAYVGAGQQQKAFRTLQSYTQKRADDWEALKSFAQVAFDLKDYEAASGAYRKLGDAGTAEPTDWFRLGLAYAETGKWAESEKALAVSGEKGEKPEGWNLLMAKVLAAQGKFAEAAPFYENEVLAAPEDAALAQAFAEICLRGGQDLIAEGKLDEAAGLLQKGASVSSPKAPEIHYRLAVTFAQLRRNREALDHLSRAVQGDPALKAQSLRDPELAGLRRLPAYRKAFR